MTQAPTPIDKATAIEAPAISAVISTRGRGELLRRTLRSIAAQDYSGDLEVVIVFDQCEIDDLDDIRAAHGDRMRIVTVSNERSPGLAGGRNTGVRHASGELIAFCDDDDEWLPTKLSAQVALYQQNPGAAVVSTGISIVTKDDTIERAPKTTLKRADLLASRVGALHPSSLLFRRQALLGEQGEVDESIPFSYGEDYDLLLRLAETGDIVSVPDPLVVVHWDRDSYFAGKWPAVAGGLSYLLEKHPELLEHKGNAARMCGQIAFAYAAAGQRKQAWSWIRRTMRRRLLEPRAWLAVLILLRLARPERIVTALNARGRGI